MNNYALLSNKRILITGGAGFIGSNLCEDFLQHDNEVICLDNFSTGKIENIRELLYNKNFKLVVGDIRNLNDCNKAVDSVDIVLHEAALGSVPRSINDPITTNSVNISGFLNMLIAAREAKVKRFVYAASSSTYGDSENLPKVEEIIGKAISPYGVTKYVNELYAHVFGLQYGLNTIGLRYFNVFGRRQDPAGAYAAVIPKFTMLLMAHKSPVIYGDGTNSRDFTYIDNIIQINHLAAQVKNPSAVGQVFNAAVGERNDLNSLTNYLKCYLNEYDAEISNIPIQYGPSQKGDIPHSLASIKKAETLLGYKPEFFLKEGLKIAVKWYWENLNK
ncbi:MAG: SDR family oxidoreductase [Ignavibacteriaceae bacterium]|nr:SDR family oxidoreductase [Ignavibacteriaceae bacterium]